MADWVAKLNEILADEWACVRALRRAETACDDPGPREVIKRVRKNCSVNCVTLANAIRALEGRPTDVPSARFSLRLKDESLGEMVGMAQSAQDHIIKALEELIDEPALKSVRSQLVVVWQLQRDDARWLRAAFAAA